MSKYIDADLLHKEIEGRLNEAVELKRMAKIVCPAAYIIHEAAEVAYRGLLLFVDSLQQEQPEVDLEKEIENYYYDNFAFISSAHTPTKDIVSDIATHFHELGQKDAANKFDEIEYNRQRAEEEMSDKTLNEKAVDYANGLAKDGISHELYKMTFVAGAKWLAAQGVSVEANIMDSSGNGYLSLIMPNNLNDRYKAFNDGDRVIVQIRKKEESK